MSNRAVVRGFVVDRTSGLGITGARVEAWDASKQLRDLVAYARSGEGGAFTMEIPEDQQGSLFGDTPATLSFRVFDGTTKNVLFDGAKNELWRLDKRATEVTLRVTPGRPVISFPKHAVAVVRGKLTGTSGPVQGAYVQAYDEHLGVLTALGATVQTDATGAYRLTYDPVTIPNGKERPDLVVKAFSSLTPLVEIAASDKLPRALATATVDLVRRGEKWQGKPAFSSTLSAVTSLVGSAPIGNLSAEQRASLADTLNLHQSEVDALSFATKLQTDFGTLTDHIAFGLIRRGLPGDADSFFQHPKAAIRNELRAAIDDNLVSQSYAATIEEVLSAQWVPAAAAWALQPRTGEVCGLAEVLEAADVNESTVRTAFAQEYCAHEGTPAAFWSQAASLSAEQKARVQLAFQHWTLARGHNPLLQHLKSLRNVYPTLESLAELTEAQWSGIVSQPGVGAPVSIPGTGSAAKEANYAAVLAASMAQAFPTKTFMHRVHQANEDEIHGFFVNHPEFVLGKDRLTKFEDALQGMTDNGNRFKAYERLYRIVPRYEPVKVLADAGYLSAHDIAQKGRDRFVSEMAAALGGQNAAQQVFRKAAWHAGASNIIYSKYAAAVQVQGHALPDLIKGFVPTPQDPGTNAIPDWTSLFGSPGSCACKHCASVLSASAYLVDLLQWLDGFDSEVDKPGGGKWSALDVLVGPASPDPAVPGRRPDIKRLELSCKGADTPLPYIDLTNEILEVAVSTRANAGSPLLLPLATTQEPADLLAGPEIPAAHLPAHIGAWKAANQAIYPLSLPVDLWAEETNAYLRYLGVSRPEILQALGSGDADAIAKCRLGTRLLGWALLLTAPADSSTPTAWGGYSAESDLAPVPVFLKRAELSFEELNELLGTRYVNGPNGLGWPSLGALAISAPTLCDPQTMTLAGLSADHLARLHPFLRLQRRLGVSITELDRMLSAFWAGADPTGIDAAMLRNVTSLLALAKELSISPEHALAFYGPLDTHEGDEPNSPYRRAFINPMVDNPNVAAFETLLTSETSTGTLLDHRLSLQQALAISASELDLLTDADTLGVELFLPSSEVVAPSTAVLSRAGVSRLHAAVTLSRALGLSLRDFLVLRALSPSTADPLSRDQAASSIDKTLEFCRLVEDVRGSALTVPEIQLALRAFAPPSSGLAPAPADLEAKRSELWKSIDLIGVETDKSDDPDGKRAGALLAELLPADAQALFTALRSGQGSPGTFAALAPFFEAGTDFDALLLGQTAVLDSPDKRYSFVAKWLERHVRSERLIIEKLASATGLATSTTRHLLVSQLASPASSSRPAIWDFLPARRGDKIADENHADEWQSSTLGLLQRHARLLKGLAIANPLPAGPDGVPAEDMGEVAWVYPALNDLPHAPAPAQSPDKGLGDARDRFVSLRVLLRRSALKKRLAGGPDALRRIFSETPDDPPNAPKAKAFLAEQTGWELATIDGVASELGYNTKAALTTDDALFRIERVVQVCRRLGLSYADAKLFLQLDLSMPDHLASGNVPPNARDQVVLARRAAKAKVPAEQWAAVARGVRDPFREKLRDTLLAYLVPRPYGSSTEVFADLLVDPEMSPCQLTSRVVQATNSVQVFVQRSLLNLDAQVKLPATASKEWEWRKAYRVWEANRKVFLYPENWIDPALRDDKTPLFKELETHLAQGELTDEAAEEAVSKYLLGLAQIANLEVMAVCDETDDDGELVATHVVGRTRSTPHRWFYRRRTPLRGWLAWEPMSLDIEGEGLLLTVQNRHLHLFWPLLMLRPDESQHVAPADSQQTIAPTMRVDVRVAFSTYAASGWTPRQTSSSAPLPIAPGDEVGLNGVGAHLVSLVLGPTEGLQSGQIPVAVVVRRSFAWLPPSAFQWPYALAGVFVFDPCGAQWSVIPKATYVGTEQTPVHTDRYSPPLPYGVELLSTGITRNPTGGPVRVPHPIGESHAVRSLEILANRPDRYRLVTPSTSAFPYLTFDRFFFEDDHRTFFVHVDRKITTEWANASVAYPGIGGAVPGYGAGLGLGADVRTWSRGQSMKVSQEYGEDVPVIEAFSHPRVCELARRLAADGLSGLLGWKEAHTDSVQFHETDVSALYGGSAVPKDAVDFSHGGSFSVYNWELFFHLPVFLASRLNAEGRYEAAQKWLHFVFDPTGGPNDQGARKFWRFRPFYENHDLASIQRGLSLLAESSSAAAEIRALVDASNAAEATVASLQAQIATLAADPFNPHAIARHRVLAYQKAVVMQYVDNLLDWGDALFRRDTMESMHEALSVYLLAADLLGPRPVTISHKDEEEPKTFEGLRSLGLDDFGNAALAVEAIVPAEPPKGWTLSFDGPPPPDARLYFGVPSNDVLAGYWDRVADRLFKLRNSMNIDGVVRTLPLFAPPIDPAILVRAAAAGVSLDKVLDSLAAPAPLFRFLRLHAKATEFASHVASLGQSLLSAIEKRDGESLGRLRQTHERNVLDAEREVRKGTIDEARQTLEGLRKQRLIIERREEFYRTIQHRIYPETEARDNNKLALARRDEASYLEIAADVAAKVPQFKSGGAGAGGSPLSTFSLGGLTVATGLSAIARKVRDVGDQLSTKAAQLQTEAGYRRRSADWNLQAELAKRELAQVDRQIAAQEIRVALAERELENLDLRRDQSQQIEDVLRSKFSNTELYDWMVTEVAAEHYRAYQVAYDMAKKAERAYQLERGDDNATFIRFGAWDSLKRGLLAGERLLADLRALDAAYLSRTDREREITKHVSLAELANRADGGVPYLVTLRDTGDVDLVEIPEWVLDADYPGHYFRRLKAVSVSVATVRSALDGVQCELTLNSSSVRKDPSAAAPYADGGVQDGRFTRSTQAIKALSTSTADDDAGLFQLDLRDEKLLPYEGQGVVGQWHIEIPRAQNRFPLHRISDVVLHLRYTARDAGKPLHEAALTHAKSANGAGTNKRARRVRTMSARAEAAEAWARFLDPTADPLQNRLEFPISRAGFQSFFGNSNVRIVAVTVSATFSEKYNVPATPPTFQITLASPIQTLPVGNLTFRTGEPSVSFAPTPVVLSNNAGLWTLTIASGATPAEIQAENGLIEPDALEDLWLTFAYEEVVP